MEKSIKNAARERMSAEDARKVAGRIMSDPKIMLPLKDKKSPFIDPEILKKNNLSALIARYLETGYPQYVIASSPMDKYVRKGNDNKERAEIPERAFRLEVKFAEDGTPSLKLSASDFYKVSYDEGDKFLVNLVFGDDALSEGNAQNHEFIASFVSALQDAGVKVPGVDVEMNDSIMNNMATLFSKLVTVEDGNLKLNADTKAYLPVPETKTFGGIELEYVRNVELSVEDGNLKAVQVRPFDKNKAFIPDSQRATPYVGMTDDIVRAIDSNKLVRTAYDPQTYCLRMLKDGEVPEPGEREILVQREGAQNTVTATPYMLMTSMCPELKEMLGDDGSLKPGSKKKVAVGNAKFSPEDAIALLHGQSVKDSTGKYVRIVLDRKGEHGVKVCDANGVLQKQQSSAAQVQAINKSKGAQNRPH